MDTLQFTGDSATGKRSKPAKPRPDFPLFAHAAGYWAKKIKGRMVYFGRWEDPAGAEAKYVEHLQGGQSYTSCQDNRCNPVVQVAPARRGGRRLKVKKPYPDFPLTPHPTGRWCKKINGQIHYFGPVDNPTAAEAKYNAEKDDLYAGRVPRPATGEVTVADVVNKFMDAKESRMKAGRITPRTLADYHATGVRIAKAFGRNRPVNDLRPSDFESYMAQLEGKWGPVAVGNEVQRVRSIFRYGAAAVDGCPVVRTGPDFKRPDRKELRRLRAQGGERMFEAKALKQIIKEADQPLKAMILLGVNVGFGNADVGSLPLTALDLKGGWVTYPRPKTGVERRAKLWPETVKALREWQKIRPVPKDQAHAGLVFLTKFGAPWHRDTRVEQLSQEKPSPSVNSPVSAEMAKLLAKLKLRRPGLSFYTLRHVCETIGGESCDQVAVNHIMGHADASMSGVYRERISDSRLAKVAAVVHRWLFGKI